MKKPITCIAADVSRLTTLGPEAVETIRANCNFKISWRIKDGDAGHRLFRHLIGTADDQAQS